MNPPAKLSELILALDTPTEEFRTYFDRKTGTLVSVEDMMLSSLEDGEEEYPDDLADWQKDEYETASEIVSDDGSRFLPPPDNYEFHEYRVMEEFIRSVDDEKTANQLWRAIKGRGAFRYFKDTLKMRVITGRKMTRFNMTGICRASRQAPDPERDLPHIERKFY